MNSEKIKKILEEETSKKDIKTEKEIVVGNETISTRKRYEILKLYGIREQPGDEVSDEDFEKIYAIYKRDYHIKSKEPLKINDKAEKILNVCSKIMLFSGIIAFVVLLFFAIGKEGSWSTFVIGLAVLFGSIGYWAFFKVFINISLKLDKLGK